MVSSNVKQNNFLFFVLCLVVFLLGKEYILVEDSLVLCGTFSVFFVFIYNKLSSVIFDYLKEQSVTYYNLVEDYSNRAHFYLSEFLKNIELMLKTNYWFILFVSELKFFLFKVSNLLFLFRVLTVCKNQLLGYKMNFLQFGALNSDLFLNKTKLKIANKKDFHEELFGLAHSYHTFYHR